MLKIKRIYDPPEPEDGQRILVDRLWPRGVTKERARIDKWAKHLAPSPALRRWYDHDPARWEQFKAAYQAELLGANLAGELRQIARTARAANITLVFAAKDVKHSHAAALLEFITAGETYDPA